MTNSFPDSLKRTFAACLLSLLILLLVTGGCVSSSQQQSKVPAPVIVTRPDSSTILVTYPGSTSTSDLLEIEVTVTDSAGKKQTESRGDKFSTTPLKFGSTLPITGKFNGNDHVLVTGYFMDGSQRVLLDTTI